MRWAWAGVVLAGLGLVLSALLWAFGVAGVTSVGDVEQRTCLNRLDDEIPCMVAGIDMGWANVAMPFVLGGSVVLAVVSIRAGSDPHGRRRRRRRGRPRDRRG